MRGVAELRAALDLTQKEMADFLGVSTAMVGLVEVHRREFSAAVLSRFGRLERTYAMAKANIDQNLLNAPSTKTSASLNDSLDLTVKRAAPTLSMEEKYLLKTVLDQPDTYLAKQAYANRLRLKLARQQQTLRRALARYAATVYKAATLDALIADPPPDASLARLEAGWIAAQKEKPLQRSASSLSATLVQLHFATAALEWEIAQMAT
jgi:transcriptional regulator with XRE-family HTH domain